MSVKLRERKLSDGTTRLFFDVYHKGKREYRTLEKPDLILYPGSNKATANANEATWAAARAEALKIEQMLAKGAYVFATDLPAAPAHPSSFLSYFFRVAKEKWEHRGAKCNTFCCYRYFERFVQQTIGMDLPYTRLTPKLVTDFRAYLLSSATPLSINSASMYFQKLKKVSLQAYREGLLNSDPGARVPYIKEMQTERQFLLPDEVDKLVDNWRANKQHDLMKRAFLFCCLTGLRWGDLTTFTWADVRETHLVLYPKKTKTKLLRVALAAFAFELMGKRGKPNEVVFPLKYTLELNHKLALWVRSCGVQKHITWHCGRHTNATNLLINNPITVVQRALGHSRLETTSIYAKVLDMTLDDAVLSLGARYENQTLEVTATPRTISKSKHPPVLQTVNATPLLSPNADLLKLENGHKSGERRCAAVGFAGIQHV